MELGKYISSLLFEHDCVVIPGFGGFVANYAPASVHPTLHTMQPPSKKITFNRQLTNNDGLLANHITRAERISFREANQYLGEQVALIEQKMQTGQRFNLAQIGDLFLDPEKNIRFDQDLNTNYYLGSFGLGSLQAKPAVGDRYEREKVFVNRPHVEQEKRKIRRLAPYLVAASVLLLFGVAIGVSILSPDTVNLAKMIDFGSHAKPTYVNRTDMEMQLEQVSPENIAFYTFDLEEDKTTIEYTFGDNHPAEGGIIVKVRDSAPEEPEVALPSAEVTKPEVGPNNYHIIAGAFRDLENATQLAEKLKAKGYNAVVLVEGFSLNKVSYSGFVHMEEAAQELSKIQGQVNPNAWIYKRH